MERGSITKESIIKDLTGIQRWAANLKSSLNNTETSLGSDEQEALLALSNLLLKKTTKVYKSLGGREESPESTENGPEQDKAISKLTSELGSFENKLNTKPSQESSNQARKLLKLKEMEIAKQTKIGRRNEKDLEASHNKIREVNARLEEVELEVFETRVRMEGFEEEVEERKMHYQEQISDLRFIITEAKKNGGNIEA